MLDLIGPTSVCTILGLLKAELRVMIDTKQGPLPSHYFAGSNGLGGYRWNRTEVEAWRERVAALDFTKKPKAKAREAKAVKVKAKPAKEVAMRPNPKLEEVIDAAEVRALLAQLAIDKQKARQVLDTMKTEEIRQTRLRMDTYDESYLHFAASYASVTARHRV